MLFDASSIYLLAKEGRIEILIGKSTLSLAIYELGNAILKDIRIFKSISPEEGMKALSFLRKILEKMEVHAIGRNEVQILKFAGEQGLTFYDAAYLQMALELEAPLVTEDEKLKRVTSALALTEVYSAHEL
ncbi:MAG TPA: type II toxin-antitoxin system VapC family toxin [Desulfobacteria bacterium]|nr:type II toxin-antitoxin system VapC family toxin [Desulfobacteria bacterium]